MDGRCQILPMRMSYLLHVCEFNVNSLLASHLSYARFLHFLWTKEMMNQSFRLSQMDGSWMYLCGSTDERFVNGMDSFVEAAMAYNTANPGYHGQLTYNLNFFYNI